MKEKLILALCILFLSTNGYCQLTRGNWLVGGNVSCASTDYKSDFGSKSLAFDLRISPQIGHFVADKFATGLIANISYLKRRIDASTNATSTDFNIGPFIRYYLLSPEKEFNILTEATYQYGFAGGQAISKKPPKNTFEIAAGPVIFFTNSMGLAFLIGYSSTKYIDFPGRNNAVQMSIGLQAHLEKEKY